MAGVWRKVGISEQTFYATMSEATLSYPILNYITSPPMPLRPTVLGVQCSRSRSLCDLVNELNGVTS